MLSLKWFQTRKRCCRRLECGAINPSGYTRKFQITTLVAMNIYLQIELDEGQECGVWLPPQENCCGACSCETGTIICPYGRTNLCNSECRCELAPEEISHTLKCDAVVKDCPARSIGEF